MRREFIDGLSSLAASDDRIVLLTADLGFSVLEPFAQHFPGRFFNVGAAEQGMIAVATGLARGGLVPYCYSIASFAVGRTWEFLRNGPVAHGLTMGLIGVGPGFDYGVDGHTHHALEDVGLLRMLPQARILCPSDAKSARDFGSSPLTPGVLTYFRLSRQSLRCPVPDLGQLRDSGEEFPVAVVALGDAWGKAVKIHQALTDLGRLSTVCVVEELGSKMAEEKLKTLSKFPTLVTVENHLTRGGLATALSEQLSDGGWSGRMLAVGASGLAVGALGSSDFLWDTQTQPLREIADWCMEIPHEG